MRSEHVSVVIRRPPAEVSAFAGDPANLPRWAAGLASGELRREGEWLVVDSPMGAVRVRVTAMNSYGVLDHDVVLPDGEVVHNPLRVVPHPDGSEVIFTVRQRGMTPAQLERDVAAVRADLERLRDLMEAVPGPEVEGGPLTPPTSTDSPGSGWNRGSSRTRSSRCAVPSPTSSSTTCTPQPSATHRLVSRGASGWSSTASSG